VARYFGDAVAARIRREADVRFGGRMTVGAAVCVGMAGLWTPPTRPKPAHLIATPTAHVAAQDVGRTLNAAWAFAAAMQAACVQNEADGGEPGIYSLAVPGLATGVGGLAPESCARQMRIAYGLFRDRTGGFDGFGSMRAALVARLVGGHVPAMRFRNVPVLGVVNARPAGRRHSTVDPARRGPDVRRVRIA
jgi:O-acetyl-ADP-ribose deacetylase (regulator of RNase III)